MSGEKSSNGLSYFRSKLIPGLSVITGDVPEGEIAHPTVSFVPYEITTDLGEHVVVGFLSTDDARAIEVLKKDANVQEIKKEVFEEYTDVENNPNTRKARG